MSDSVISGGAIARIKNRLYPNEGVIYAIWQVIVYRTPYHTRSNPSAPTSGNYSGATMMSIAVSSRNIPMRM